MQFNALSITKTIVEAAVSYGAGAVVGNAIKASVPENAKLVHKIGLAIGGIAISGLVGDMVSKRTSEKIDETIETFTKAKKSVLEIEVKPEDENEPEGDTEPETKITPVKKAKPAA